MIEEIKPTFHVLLGRLVKDEDMEAYSHCTFAMIKQEIPEADFVEIFYDPKKGRVLIKWCKYL